MSNLLMFKRRHSLVYPGLVMSTRKFPSPLKKKDLRKERRHRIQDNGQENGTETVAMTKIHVNRGLDRLDSVNSSDQKFTGHQSCCSCIIFHEGRFKVLWDWMVLILVIFTAIQIPYYAAFETDQQMILDLIYEDTVHPIVILSLIVDCMFILDIFINFRTTYVKSSSDEVVRNPKLLAFHYLKTWFVIDLLAAIPFDWILYKKGQSDNTSTLIGLLKSARLLRLFRVARRVDRYSEYGLAVLVLLLSLFTLISHWLACIWNGIARKEEEDPSSWVRKMDAVLHGPFNGTIRMSTSQRYISSLYFIVSSLTSVGFGNVAATTEAEQIFSVVTMLLGALMYATIFGNMVAIVQRLYSKASSFHTQMNTVREFMKFYKIPEDLKRSINNYVRREWSSSNGVDVETVLHRFPECIQADLTYELYQGLFHSVKPLREASVSCMRALAMKFKTITLQVNNFTLRQGEEVNKLYILGKGSLEVITDGELKAILPKYSVFGYDFVKRPRLPKSSANVRASSLVEIHYIYKQDMIQILSMYPKFAQKFCNNLKLGYDLNDEFEEGTRRQVTRKDKVHLSTAAKNALNIPLMARFTRNIRRKISRGTSLNLPSSLNNTTSANQNGKLASNGLHTVVTVGNEHAKKTPEITAKSYTQLSETTSQPLQRVKETTNSHTQQRNSKSSLNSVRFSFQELETHSKTSYHYELENDFNAGYENDLVTKQYNDKTLETLNKRLEALENNVACLKTDVDHKLNYIISILDTVKNTVGERSSFEDGSSIEDYEHVDMGQDDEDRVADDDDTDEDDKIEEIHAGHGEVKINDTKL